LQSTGDLARSGVPKWRALYEARGMTSLTELANKYGTDKGTISQASHSYTVIYDMLFNAYRNQNINILEIGLSTGGPELGNSPDRVVTDAPSIRMWHEFFPNGKIYGIDISDFSRFQNEWFSFMRADCGDAQQLDQISRCGVAFDIIVDDGSHASFHQQLTLQKLFGILKNGGFYIIEDLHWQPLHYERSLPSTPDTTKQLRTFIKEGDFISSTLLPVDTWSEVAKKIRNVILLDDDELYGMQRIYNRGFEIQPENPHYFDKPLFLRLLSRGYVRRLFESSAEFSRASTGRFGPLRRSRTKLAIIHKK
jgi:SAM-dependent methyltransferase